MKILIKIILSAAFFQLIYIDHNISQKIDLKSNTIDSPKIQSNKIPSSPILYFIDSNKSGIYENVQLNEEPIPFIGLEKFIRKLLRSIRYPALAKETGIEGNVILEIFVNELGNIDQVNIFQSVSKECDDEARKRFIEATTNGYAQLKIDSKPVKYKMHFPIKFKLN